METVIVLGIPIVKGPGTTLTLATVKPGRTGVAPVVGVPYKTMFCTAVLNAADGLASGESYGTREAYRAPRVTAFSRLFYWRNV
jgi:hypothetical protein